MIVVHFIENRNKLLTQIRKHVPKTDETIKIKGRTGKVVTVKEIDGKSVHVQVTMDTLKKNIVANDPKKKRR